MSVLDTLERVPLLLLFVSQPHSQGRMGSPRVTFNSMQRVQLDLSSLIHNDTMKATLTSPCLSPHFPESTEPQAENSPLRGVIGERVDPR